MDATNLSIRRNFSPPYRLGLTYEHFPYLVACLFDTYRRKLFFSDEADQGSPRLSKRLVMCIVCEVSGSEGRDTDI